MEQRSTGAYRIGSQGWWRRIGLLTTASLGCLTGCTTMDTPFWEMAETATERTSRASGFGLGSESSDSFAGEDGPVPKVPNKALESTPIVDPRPAYARIDKMPIDLPTVIRMVDSNSPTIQIAQAKVREAEARLEQAELLWVPNIQVGAAYNRFDGQTQNQRGEIFDVARGNLFGGGGVALNVDLADAFYRPLIERRENAATQFRAQAATIGTELEAVLAYLDLVQIHSQIEINRDTLEKAEANVEAAKRAQTAKLDRTAGDINRSMAEVYLRRAERTDLQAKANAAGARLARLLLLPSTVTLVPAEMKVTPIELITPTTTLDDLIATALGSRPDLAANREALQAALTRVRRQEYGPLIPKVGVINQTGTYGGGLRGDLTNFSDRNALTAQIFWELKNFGLGNVSETAERRAMADQVSYQLLENQARVTAEIIELAQAAASKQEILDLADKNVKETLELYRISKEGVLNVVDGKNLYDALRPLQAIQLLNAAKQNYLAALVDFNRAQFRLYVALGRPPLEPSR